MRSRPPGLLPIFRSQRQALLLATLFLHPDRELTIGELARRVGVPVTSIQRDVEALVEAEILRSRTVGRARLVSGNAESRLARPLTDLLAVTYGPLTVVGEEFGEIEEVDRVLIYGSWAARYQGAPGPPPQDLDVLVVGAPARPAVYDAAERAGRRLDMPVNPTISSRRRWADAADGLIQQIKASPAVVVLDRTS
jgi:DNA-binding transcriptional ArsR family regulator